MLFKSINSDAASSEFYFFGYFLTVNDQINAILSIIWIVVFICAFIITIVRRNASLMLFGPGTFLGLLLAFIELPWYSSLLVTIIVTAGILSFWFAYQRKQMFSKLKNFQNEIELYYRQSAIVLQILGAAANEKEKILKVRYENTDLTVYYETKGAPDINSGDKIEIVEFNKFKMYGKKILEPINENERLSTTAFNQNKLKGGMD